MAEKYSTPLSKTDLIFRHIDRMSEKLNQSAEYSKTGQMLFSYFYNVQHMENILTDSLDLRYKEKKEEIFKKINFSDIGQNPKPTFEFFNQVSQWFQLLYMYAVSTGIIKEKKIFRPTKKEYFTDTI